MAGTPRTHSATARARGWDDVEAQAQRTGNWLPLDALTEDELFAGTPRLRAVGAPHRETGAAQRSRTEAHRPTAAQRASVAVRNEETAPASILGRGVQVATLARIAAFALLGLSLFVVAGMAIEWTQVKLDDVRYGRPRTMQIDAYVGHGEAGGTPSHFVAMNLNRRITVMELPGGDATKANTLVGPYLFGQNEDLTPVQIESQDVNADGKADVVLTVKSEQLVYLNDGTAFKLMTAEERNALQKSLAAQTSAAAQVPATNSEAGK